jgi:hypothetical protein
MKIIDLCGRENLMPRLASGFARSERGRSIDPLACYCYHPRVCVSCLSKGDHILTRFDYFPWKFPNSFAGNFAVQLNNGNAGISRYTQTQRSWKKRKLIVAYFLTLPTVSRTFAYVSRTHLSYWGSWYKISTLQIYCVWNFMKLLKPSGNFTYHQV